MTISADGPVAGGPSNLGLTDPGSVYREIGADQRAKIQAAGRRFAKVTGGSPCLVLVGRLTGAGDPGGSTERAVQRCCEERFGFPKSSPEETINVILDSTGGPLDSAFKTVLYLSRYAKNINVHVPRKAKSASTLIAVGANAIFMSPFSELGPLDTQISDPRNPTDYMSALDCYQSVDYVRDFGFGTLSQALKHLAAVTQGKITLIDSVNAATQFAIGSITRTEKIARRLVYGYTHHLFPIDIIEARDMGLNPQEMSIEQYQSAVEIVNACDNNEICIEFADGGEQAAGRGASSVGATVTEMAVHQDA